MPTHILNKMEECVHIACMPLFPLKVKGKKEKLVKSKILGLSFMVPDIVHKFQIIFLQGT
jgi:hypothetical protein